MYKKLRSISKKRKIKLMICILILDILFFLSYLYYVKMINKIEKLSLNYVHSQTQEFGTYDKQIKFKINNNYYITYPKVKSSKINRIIEKKKDEIANFYKSSVNLSNILKEKYTYRIITCDSVLAIDNLVSVIFNEYLLDNNGKPKGKKVYISKISIDTEEEVKDSYVFVGNYKSKLDKLVTNYLAKHHYTKKTKYIYSLNKKGFIIYIRNQNKKDYLHFIIPYSKVDFLNIDSTTKTKKSLHQKDKDEFKTIDTFNYVKREANLYNRASINSEMIKTIDKGFKVKVLKRNNMMSKVLYKDKYYYIKNTFLSDDIVADKDYIDCDDIVYALDNVEVKNSPKENAKIIKILKRKESIRRIGTSDIYSEVVIDGKKGFALNRELSLIEPDDDIVLFKRDINPYQKMVAITFDDGPNIESTSRILDILEKNGVVATFFDLGSLVNKYPSIVRREEELGCDVGSHTYSHANLNKLSIQEIEREISNSRSSFINALGHDINLFRPPYGNTNDLVISLIPYPIINWNVDTLDWKSRNKDEIIKEVMEIKNLDGKIILMHSIYNSTADALEVIIPRLIDDGYQLVTISEMAFYKGVKLKSGNKYYGF